MAKFIKSLITGGVASLAAGSGVLAWDGAQASRQCFGRVVLPPTYQAFDRTVVESPGHVERRYVPAEVEAGVRRTLVRPARVERLSVAAVYATRYVSETAPGPRRWVRAPARYGVQTEHELVAPGRWVWRRRDGPLASGPPQPGQTLISPTGVVLCRVWCPARYADVERQVRLASGRSYSVATVTRRVTAHRVMVRPARVVERRIEAQYRTVRTARTVVPAHVEFVRVAARYGVVHDRRLVQGGEGWSPVVCGGPLSRPALQRMQASLGARGYDAGPPDGLERPQTYDALHRYQVDHRMAAGQITVESAEALGVVR